MAAGSAAPARGDGSGVVADGGGERSTIPRRTAAVRVADGGGERSTIPRRRQRCGCRWRRGAQHQPAATAAVRLPMAAGSAAPSRGDGSGVVAYGGGERSASPRDGSGAVAYGGGERSAIPRRGSGAVAYGGGERSAIPRRRQRCGCRWRSCWTGAPPRYRRGARVAIWMVGADPRRACWQRFRKWTAWGYVPRAGEVLPTNLARES